MVDQVYRIGDLRDKVLTLLRKTGRVMSAGEIAEALSLPYWAAKAGIDSAQAGGLAVYVFGAGYEVESKQHLALVDSAQAATNLIA